MGYSENYFASDTSPPPDLTSMLVSMEYSLRLLSGGSVLVLCSLFTWLFVIKPLKYFTDF